MKNIVVHIENNIPMPPNPRKGKCDPIRKALVTMRVDESFFVYTDMIGATSDKNCADRMSSVINGVEKGIGRPKKFALRTLTGGCRIWRII